MPLLALFPIHGLFCSLFAVIWISVCIYTNVVLTSMHVLQADQVVCSSLEKTIPPLHNPCVFAVLCVGLGPHGLSPIHVGMFIVVLIKFSFRQSLW